MVRQYAEPAFHVVVAVATGFLATSLLLGLFLRPAAAVAVGGTLVAVGAVRLAPPGRRALAGAIGLAGLLLGGGAVPVVVARVVRPGTVPVAAVAITGLVLLATSATVHLTAFGSRGTPA